jgi:phenylpyruvate tautomerase PptA (4-oxalocrotonate tautomerase family)
MPLLSIETNAEVSAPNIEALLSRASALVARELGKSERYVMLRYEHNPSMRFAGSDAPLAYLILKSIGLPEGSTPALSKALCDLIEEAIGVAPERVYIEFVDAPRALWGWNAKTF